MDNQLESHESILLVELTVDLLLLVIHIFDRRDVQGGLVREHQSSRLQVLVTGENDGVQHGLVQQEVPHPFRDDDIELLDRQVCFFEFAFYKGDS